MNRLRCDDCGTLFYSAAAKTLVEQGATCAKCGGKLVLVLEVGSNPKDARTPTGSLPGNGEGDGG